MNYYIQGSPTRAEQIKAAFQELGINVLDFGFADKTVVYCSIGECVQYLPYSIHLMNILYSHPDYQELELTTKPNFKVGDWLWHKTKGVFPLMVDGYDEKEGYLIKYLDSKCYFGCDIIENEYRLWNFGDSKRGDILYDKAYNRIGIFENFGHHPDGGSFNDKTYCFLSIYYDVDDDEFYEKTCNDMDGYDVVPATKEQRELFFSKMKEAGYEWDENKKEVKKIQHYDIANFQAGMPVLVRDGDCDDDEWTYALFSHYNSNRNTYKFSASGDVYLQCIPLNEKTKYLLGTTDMCPEEYINW